MERGLERRECRLPVRIGVDETSFQKLHEYVTVALDQEEGTVVHVADGRGRDTLDGFFDEARREENKALVAEGDERLKGTIHPRWLSVDSFNSLLRAEEIAFRPSKLP